MSLDQILPTFLAESREVLQEMEDGLLSIQTTHDLPAVIGAIFRAAHTVKGAAGVMELSHVVTFTHAVETVLDEARQGNVGMSSELVALLLACCDHIKTLVDEVASGHVEPDQATLDREAPLVEQLRRHADSPGSPLAAGSMIDLQDSVAEAPGETHDARLIEKLPEDTARGPARLAMVDAALATQKRPEEARAHHGRSIRVDAEKLDHLIDLVGELIIGAAHIDMIGRETRNAELQESTATLTGLVREVRDSALQLRMVKIGTTFNRFQRVVHDISRELGKDIALVVDGVETELDKTVVERISDPLMHLVRNALDHGIESAEQRLASGKPAQGTVYLNAYHDSDSIVIEVSDDGGGLKRERILPKAVERGLVQPGRTLGDPELYALIFEPGFSTAEQVTNLSGRGVGMDVVKRNITALRGSVDIHSEEGLGTTVTVRMPLTLAIINGFLVGLGGSVFVIPLDVIDECLEFTAEPGHDYTNVRGQVLPFIRLRDIFDVPGAATRRQSIVVVNCAGRRSGLVVDTLLGEFQTVIKPLDTVFNRVQCIGGSTILGNGEVALILDVPALVEQTRQSTHGAMT
jgi:chemotaxis protein histidine kinase CheA